MKNDVDYEIFPHLKEKDLKPPEYYPMKWAIRWIAYGDEVINTDYARILYERIPVNFANDTALQIAEKKLFVNLLKGSIRSRHYDVFGGRFGDYDPLEPIGEWRNLNKESWNGGYDWHYDTLEWLNPDCGTNLRYHDIEVNTQDLLSVFPPSDKSKINIKNITSNELATREKETYQNIIGALLGLLLGKSSSGVAYSNFDSQQAIIDMIHTLYGDRHGLSRRNLESKFAESKRTLKSNFPDSE